MQDDEKKTLRLPIDEAREDDRESDGPSVAWSSARATIPESTIEVSFHDVVDVQVDDTHAEGFPAFEERTQELDREALLRQTAADHRRPALTAEKPTLPLEPVEAETTHSFSIPRDLLSKCRSEERFSDSGEHVALDVRFERQNLRSTQPMQAVTLPVDPEGDDGPSDGWIEFIVEIDEQSRLVAPIELFQSGVFQPGMRLLIRAHKL